MQIVHLPSSRQPSRPVSLASRLSGRLPARLFAGISAAALAIGFVLLAGLTAPSEESTLHASAKCPAGADKSPLESVTSGAESPA